MKLEETTEAELVEELAVLRREVEEQSARSARIEHSEDVYTRFFEQSLEMLCIAGFDGYFKHLNPRWTARLGWTLQELEARPFLEFVHPDDRESTLVQVDQLGKGAEIIQFENRYRHKDGSYRWLRWNARPVPDRQQIYASARDVTRKKRLELEVLEIADREKERLGRELHDGLCQTLAGIAALSATLSRKLARGPESAAAADARDINTLLNEAVGETRDMARGYGPPGLSGEGLGAVLETFAQTITERFGVACRLENDHEPACAGSEVEAQLYRLVQEAVNNAVNHAGARQIDISLRVKAGEGQLSIADDGEGITEGHAEGLGMYTMAYRAHSVGGQLKVRRRTPHGTTVRCTFPVHDAPDTTVASYHDHDDH